MKVLLIVLSIFASLPAFALTCKNDYGGNASCAANSTAAGDCQTLGFAKAEVNGCAHYLYCPFDTSYKRCASMTPKSCAELGFTQSDKSAWCNSLMYCDADNSYSACTTNKVTECPAATCPTGWSSTAKCSTVSESGWTVESIKFTDTLTCSRCTCQAENTCIWTTASAGAMGSLSNKCCNGNYKNCTNNCKDTYTKPTPANAVNVTENCPACGTTKAIVTGYACKQGYGKYEDGCLKCGNSVCSAEYDSCSWRCDDTYGQGCGQAGGWECDAQASCRDDCYSYYCSPFKC